MKNQQNQTSVETMPAIPGTPAISGDYPGNPYSVFGRVSHALRNIGFKPNADVIEGHAFYINKKKTHFQDSKHQLSKPKSSTKTSKASPAQTSRATRKKTGLIPSEIKSSSSIQTKSTPSQYLKQTPATQKHFIAKRVKVPQPPAVHNHTDPDIIEVRIGATSDITGVSPVGIDTLHLYFLVEPRQIRSNHRLEVKKNRDSAKDVLLFIDSDGVAVEAKEANWKDEYIHVSINSARKVLYRKREAFTHGACSVQFSVAKICGKGDNTQPPSLGDTLKALSHVARILESIGIEVDLNDASVTRLDLFRNIVTASHDVRPYIEVFKRVNLSCKGKLTFPTGNLDYNKSESASIYDKKQEQGDDDPNSTGLLRIERQIKNSPAVKRVFGQRLEVRDLLAQFDRLPDLYDGWLRKTYFKSLDSSQKPRPFPKGQVGHQLDTLWNGLQSFAWAQGWSRKALHDTLDVYGLTGLSGMLKNAATRTTGHKATAAQRDWLARRLRELRKALVREALEEPEFASRYMELQKWLLNTADMTATLCDDTSLVPERSLATV